MEASLDSIVLLVVHNLPQALLVALVVLVVGLVAKDALNGAFRRPFLSPDRFQPLTCVDIKTLSHNTRRFRFALPHQEQLLGLPLGQHITIKGTAADGTAVLRCVVGRRRRCSCCLLDGAAGMLPSSARAWLHKGRWGMPAGTGAPPRHSRSLSDQAPLCLPPHLTAHRTPPCTPPCTGPTPPPPSCSSGATSTL